MRHILDRYDSPRWFAEVLAQRIPIQGTVFEPCTGSNVLANYLATLPSVTAVYTNDLDTSAQSDSHFDASQIAGWFDVDWVVTNPPFNQSFEIVKHAIRFARIGVAMALRETWLGSASDRLEWLAENPPTDIISMPRYAFRKGISGRWMTDSAAIWWVVWQKNRENDGFRFYAVPKSQIPNYTPHP